MTFLELFNTPFARRLLLSMLHLLWVGTAIAVTGCLLARTIGENSSRRRHGIYIVTICAIMASLGIIFAVFQPKQPPTATAIIGQTRTQTPEQPLKLPVVSESPPIEQKAWLNQEIIPPTQPQPTPAIAVTTRKGKTFDWQRVTPYIMAIYLAGVIAMFSRLIVGLGGGQKLRKRSQPVDDPAILTALAKQARALGIAFTPAIAFCRKVIVPTVVGVVRPTILLPFTFASGLSAGQIEMLLAHELAHIRRLDPIVNILQRIIESLLFFHPAVWFISRKIGLERENCCDDIVVQSGGTALSYASSLVETARRGLTAATKPVTAETLTATGRPSQLRTRIQRLLGPPSNNNIRLRHSWIIGTILLAALGFGAISCFDNNEVQKDEDITSPNDIKIELIGLSTYPLTEASVWWKPDGAPLENAPYNIDHGGYIPSDENEVRYEFALNLDGVKNGLPSLKIKSFPKAIGTGATTESESGTVRDIAKCNITLPSEVEVVDIEVGHASGRWKTVHEGKTEFYVTLDQGNSIVFEPSTKKKNLSSVRLTHTTNENDIRVVAVDRKNNIHKRKRVEGGGPGEIRIMDFDFDLPFNQIKTFQIQTREYEWVEFKNVSLRPGKGEDKPVSEMDESKSNSSSYLEGARKEINWTIADYGQTRWVNKTGTLDSGNLVSLIASVVKNMGSYLVPENGLTLKDLIKAAGYRKDRLGESYVEVIRSRKQDNITLLLIFSRNLKTLFNGKESDIALQPHDSVLGGFIPSHNAEEFWGQYSFSDVVEFTVNNDGEGVDMFADLDSAKLITPPDTLDNSDENTVFAWMTENGIDVMGETADSVRGLVGFNMYAARVDNYFWGADKIEITGRLSVRVNDPVLLTADNFVPVTYLIKTSEYKLGILQILGFTENLRGIKIRYKLLIKNSLLDKPGIRLEAKETETPARRLQFRFAADEGDTGLVDVFPWKDKSKEREPPRLEKEILFDESDIKSAEAEHNPDTDEYVIRFELKEDAGKRFAQLTDDNIGQRLAIIFDGEVLSAPSIHSRIGGKGTIVGNFDRTEAEEIAEVLNGGQAFEGDPVVIEVVANEKEYYNVGAYKVEAGFAPDKAEIILGEPLFITYYVKNAGEKPFKLFVGGDQRGIRPGETSITAVDAEGNKVKDPNQNAPSFGGPGGNIIIEPGEIYSERRFLPKWCEFEKPGEYILTCKRTIKVLDANKNTYDNDEYVDQPVLSTFVVTVRPYRKEAMQEVIENLGEIILGEEKQPAFDAAQMLAYIRDASVVPHLVKAVELKRNAGAALKGLSRYPCEESVDAMAKGLEYRGDSFVRSVAAYGLSKMKSQKAVAALIKALDDNDEYVRRGVIRSLGKIGDKNIVAVLKNYFDDPSMNVRFAIVESLKELGEPFNEELVIPIIRSKESIWQNAVWFVRRNAGNKAPAVLIKCLDMDDSSVTSYYNNTLVWQIAACGGPKFTYHHEFDGKDTEKQIQENRKILDELKVWLDQYSTPDADTPTNEQVSLSGNSAFPTYLTAAEFLHNGGDREAASNKFWSAYKKYPDSPYATISYELYRMLGKMADEDERYAIPDVAEPPSIEKQISHLMYKLRDVAEQERDVPGKCKILVDPRTPDSAAVALRDMGKTAVPALIGRLNDRRPTRSVGLSRNGGVVLRYCDVALEIIEAIAGETFDRRTGRGTFLSTADEKTRKEIIARVEAWWSANDEHWLERITDLEFLDDYADSFSWGQPITNVRLGAAPYAPVHEIGGPILIKYALENRSYHTIRISPAPSIMRTASVIFWTGGGISVTDPKGNPIHPKSSVSDTSSIDIVPNQTYIGQIDLTRYFDITDPGDYKVTLSIRPYPADDYYGDEWFDVESEEISLTLVESDSNHLDAQLELNKQISTNVVAGAKDRHR